MPESARRGQDCGQTSAPDQVLAHAATMSGIPQSATNLADHAQSKMVQGNSEATVSQTKAQNVITSPSFHQVHQGSFDMTFIGNPLPTMSLHPQHTHHYIHGTSQPYNPTTSPPMHLQPHQMSAFGGPLITMANHPYYVGQAQIPHYYQGSHLPYNQPQRGMHGRPNMVYYSNQAIMSHAQPGFYFPPKSKFDHSLMVPTNVSSRQHIPGASTTTAATTGGRPSQYGGRNSNKCSGNQDSHTSRQTTVRGPPRKPRQSGHALWIGNLPPQADLMALVQHICKETPGMESLFLITKSNCAFANFKDEPTCSAAQETLHDSRFQSIRLVSRLRKNNVENSSSTTVPSSNPAVAAPASLTGETNPHAQPSIDGMETAMPVETDVTIAPPTEPKKDGQARCHVDKFFILKSLTTEDLDLSVQTGVWATQSHNENSLNKAYQTADNVYLIFSANKSGEYFGYARMTSKMNNDPEAAIEVAPKAPVAAEVDLPKAISTDATEFVPRGKIIDDSARGTIFWEAERDASKVDLDIESETTSEKSIAIEEEAKTWGKPFELEWLSTTRLPFFRARGLRNPWNSNREVKIARDGTELEPSVGRKLIGLFNRVQSSAATVPDGGMPINFAPLCPPMR